MINQSLELAIQVSDPTRTEPDFRYAVTLSLSLEGLETLLLLMLLLHLLSLSHALVTVFCGHRPFPLEHLHPEACVERVTAGEVAVGKPTMRLMLATVGDELEVTHRAGETLSVCFSHDALKVSPVRFVLLETSTCRDIGELMDQARMLEKPLW